MAMINRGKGANIADLGIVVLDRLGQVRRCSPKLQEHCDFQKTLEVSNLNPPNIRIYN
jgi:hypothetical protein